MAELIENILEMIQIKSISGNEPEIRKMIEWVKEHYAPKGVRFEEMQFEGAAPVLLLANCPGYDFDVVSIGHLDVVPAGDALFEPRLEQGRILGRGSFDMKSSVAVCLETLLYAVGQKIRFGVIITFDEETTSGGMKALQKMGKITAQAVLDTDCGDDIATLVEKYKHPVSVEIRAQGQSAHSSRPWEGKNAITSLMAAIGSLAEVFPQYEVGGLQPENTWVDTMAVTAFNSPTSYNVVPDSAWARLNFRLTEKTSLPQLEKILSRVCQKYGCQYTILLSSSGVYMDVKNPLIQKYMAAAEKVLGRKMRVTHTCGATDSRMFAEKSAVIMHGISGGNAHGEGEYAEVESVYQLLAIQRDFIDNWMDG